MSVKKVLDQAIALGVFLLLVYIVVVGFMVASKLDELNSLKIKAGEERINIVNFFAENYKDIFLKPFKIIDEIDEECARIEANLKNPASTVFREILPKRNGSYMPEVSKNLYNRSLFLEANDSAKRIYLASYLALLDEVEKKLKRFDLDGELYLSNSSKYANLSEDMLLDKIKEKEKIIDKLARQTLRRKIDYGGVEINRFEGEKYFVFLKKNYKEITVAWRPLLFINVSKIYSRFTKIYESYMEIMGLKTKNLKKYEIYLWDKTEDYREATKSEYKWSKGGVWKKYGTIMVHVSGLNERNFEHVFTHELTHSLDNIYGRNPIDLLQEGFAEYMTIKINNEYEPSFPSNINIKGCVEHFPLYASYGSYQYSYWFVKFLIEKYGIEKFREIYEISNYNDVEVGWKYVNQKFKNVYGKDLEELDKELREWYYSNK